MKNLFIFLSFSFIISFSHAQQLIEKILSNEIKLAISDGVRFDDGNWMFSAYAYSITPGDSAMAIVFKTDSSFTPLWAKRFKALRGDDFSCITPLIDGNVLVGGAMRQGFAIEEGGSVFKLDTAGNIIWHLMYEEDHDDRVLDIFEEADSSLMIFIREGVTNRPTKIVHAAKDGTIISQRTYTFDTSNGLLANVVISDENEQYYFSGAGNFQGSSEAYVCAVDNTNLLWFKRYKIGGRDVGQFASAYNPYDQTIILGGSIKDTVGIFVNFWLLKTDLQGNVIWSKEYGGDLGYTEDVSVIKPLSDGNIMVFGRAFSDQGSQGFAMKLDAQGNKLWVRGYNPTSPTVGIGDVFSFPDGRMLINANSGQEIFLMTTTADAVNACSISDVSLNVAALSVEDSSYALNSAHPGIVEFIPPLDTFDISIDDSLLCEASVGIEEFRVQKLEIYPNPVNDQLTVVLPENINSKLECRIIDATGRTIIPNIIQNSGELNLNVSDLPAGIYWILLNVDRKVFSQKFVRI
ncbi:MAG: T9SS type A sorting domain-containing protein [Bacteroidetes bacterium]|nr:T9SS type A sorting domain-containing protein [Bacteroidota bacterium]